MLDPTAPATAATADRWKTFTESLRQFLDHERWKVILPLVVCGVFVTVLLTGCQPNATLDGVEVTPENINTVYEEKASALQRDYAAWLAQGEQLKVNAEALDASYTAAFDSIEKQVAERNQWISTIGGFGLAAIDGTLNPASAIGSVLPLLTGSLALGGYMDARRKNKVIDRLKTTNGTGA